MDFRGLALVRARRDGALGALLRNPERNIGVRYDIDRLVRDGSAIRRSIARAARC